MIPRHSKRKDWTQRFLLFFCATLLWLPLVPMALAADAFPIYPCIQKNIRFWEAIYSRYTTCQGVLHDADDLGRVYTVIDLVHWKVPGAATLNSERVRQGKERIHHILDELAAGRAPRTAEAQRIAALFPSGRQSAFRAAKETLRLQLGQKDRFGEGVVRSGRYLSEFSRIFASQGLPRELVYLPHVESSFNPSAYSKAGAAGLWQFTRSTGSDYLVINDLIDERYDPYLATEAAARLLRDNYNALGTWPLALTAYNYGRAGMMRALRSQGSYEKIFNTYDQGYFKFASRNFYSEFLAAMQVAKRLEAHLALRLERPEYTKSFRLQHAMPIARLQSLVGLSQAQFVRLNPALQKPVLENRQAVPQGYRVRTPASKPAQAIQIAQKTPQKIAIKRQPRVTGLPSSRHIAYVIQKGDSLLSIARKFQLPPQVILAANKQRDDVQLGETLLLPSYN